MDKENKRHFNLISKFFRKEKREPSISSDIDLKVEHELLINYYLSLIENYPGVFLLLSLDGEIIAYNKAAMGYYLGYNHLNKLNIKDTVTKEDFSILASAFHQTKRGKTSQVEVEMLSKKQEWLNVFITFIPVKLVNKNVDSVIVILDDITHHRELEESFRLKTNHLEQAQQIANVGSWEYIIATDEIIFSPAYADIFGFNPEKRLSRNSLFSLVHPDDRNHLAELSDKAITDGVNFFTKHRIYHGMSGELRYIKVKVEVMTRNQKPYKLIGVVKDITNDKMLHEKIMETNRWYKYLFDHLHAGIWMTDCTSNQILIKSKGLHKLLNNQADNFDGSLDSWKKFIHPKDWKGVKANYKLLRKGEMIEQRYRVIDQDGFDKWIYEQTIPQVNEHGDVTHYFGLLTDISEQVNMEEQMLFLAKHDALTSLPNYHSFHTQLDHLLNNHIGTKFALYYIDIDNFYEINYSLGHKIGDKVIKQVASRLTNILPVNGYVAKLDNDTFAFILHDYKEKETVLNFAEKISKVIREKFTINGYNIYITVSIGISFYANDEIKKEILLNNAQSALFHAQRLGKNNYQVYSHKHHIDSLKKYILEKDLRSAIENDEFELYYQPQVNPHTEAIIGAETLIRWNHNEWGIVSPNEFIPLAEQKHLIHEISYYIIRSVCQQLHKWRRHGYTLVPISVNISPLCFLKPGFINAIKTSLKIFNIPAEYLELEITESTLLENELYVTDKINKLKEIGVKLAIDDFGTGFTSFQLLQNFHFDKLKFDKSFVQNLDFNDENNVKQQAIVASFLYLGKELNIDVVAEGVEEYDQLHFLIQRECPIIQGYIYSKPVPVNQFEKLMKARYIKPIKEKTIVNPKKERRQYYRFIFPTHLLAKMYVIEVDQEKVAVGPAEILIENISAGGLRFLTTLRLPVSPKVKLKFEFIIMNIQFAIDGFLVYRNEEKTDIYSYGVSFEINEGERNRLAKVVNRLTVLDKSNSKIPYTNLIIESPYTHFRKDMT